MVVGVVERVLVPRDEELSLRGQARKDRFARLGEARRLGEPEEGGAKLRAPFTIGRREPERAELLHGVGHARAHALLRDPLVDLLLPGKKGPNEVVRAEHRRELPEDVVARDRAAVLHRPRVEVEQRHRLADQHLDGAEVPLPELVRRGQKVKVAVGLVDELGPEPLVEGLEVGPRLGEERVQGEVVGVDVTAAAEREIRVGEEGIGHHVLEPCEAGRGQSATPFRGSDHSSSS